MTFWNERRRRVYPRLIVTAVVVWSVLGFTFLWARAASSQERYGGDFVVYWSAAKLAQHGHPEDAFDYSALLAQERKTVPASDLYPWHYPPQFLLIVRPLAVLPYPAALTVWTLGGLSLLYLALLRSRGLSPGVIGLPIGGVVINAGFGQNGALTGALLGLGLPLSESRPFAGGLVLGLLTYKPHLAPVALLFLVLTRNWRACCGAAVSACSLALASLAAFGPSTWAAFFANGSNATKSLFESGAWQQMPSPVAAAQLAGGAPPLAITVQAVWSMAFVAGAGWLVLSGAPRRLVYSGICVASLAASPYVFFYDTAALAPAFAWLLSEARLSRLATYERIGLGMLAVGWPAAWALAATTHVQFGPLLLAVLMVLVLNRARPFGAPAEHGPRPWRFVRAAYEQGFPVRK